METLSLLLFGSPPSNLEHVVNLSSESETFCVIAHTSPINLQPCPKTDKGNLFVLDSQLKINLF